MKQKVPHGSWRSPITSDRIVTDTISLDSIRIDGPDIYWVEGRPAELGRYVIVRHTPGGATHDVNAPPHNARTRVHEYGGGAYLAHRGTVVFSNFADQRLYFIRAADGADVVAAALTPEANLRFADGDVDRERDRIFYVREDHTDASREAVNTIVAIDLRGRLGPGSALGAHAPEPDDVGQVLLSGSDFYSSPRLSPDGSQLAWLSWNHPNMPWDGTELRVVPVRADGSLGDAKLVAGGPRESVVQPVWSPDGVLHFVSDRTGWWNLYRSRAGRIEALCEKEAEFAGPQWVFGLSHYGFESEDSLLCTYSESGKTRLARVDLRTLELSEIETPYQSISAIQVGNGFCVLVAGMPTKPLEIVRLDLASGEVETLQRAGSLDIAPGYLSTPETVSFPTQKSREAHAFYYAPSNRDFEGSEGERPPLLVKSHGGPTSAARATFQPGIQYWTSRGFAVLDVNYGGSTGFGRPYRERLNGEWGVVDVEDCVNGARWLVEQGLVDPDRLAIDGGSAGGYTTLCALAFHDVFRAGASHFGISDLMVFVDDTHKFESRYLDSLVGPYPEKKDVYRERSALHHVDRLSCPIIFFQGDEDKIVPPNQAEIMVEALRAKGIPVAYLLFEGEQHGFRKAENIRRALDGELWFYSRIFGFEPADEIEPIEIENLERLGESA